MRFISLFLYLILVTVTCTLSFGQEKKANSDSLSRRQLKKHELEAFRKSNDQFFFKFSAVNANLDTKISFDLLDGLLTASLGLEDNLGLPGKKTFFNASFIHRFTPVSGMYVRYYGINRKESMVTEQDHIFLGDTIPKGTTGQAFFNTQVISAGYLVSLLRDPDAFLGAYINIYLMWLKTGIESSIGNIDANLSYAVPLPNFGLVAMFKLKKWLYLDGTIGFFSLKFEDFNGIIYDFSASLVFKPVSWMGLSLSYQEFDIRVKWPYDGIDTTVEYNFRGPALGAVFNF